MLLAVTGAGNSVALGQSPSAGVASVKSGAEFVLSSPQAGSVVESILQNRAASSSDISTYPSKWRWYGDAGVKHLAVSLSVMTVHNTGKIGKIYAFYAMAKNIAFFHNVLLRYGRILVKEGRLLKPHFIGTFHYALAEDPVKRCGHRKDIEAALSWCRSHQYLGAPLLLLG